MPKNLNLIRSVHENIRRDDLPEFIKILTKTAQTALGKILYSHENCLTSMKHEPLTKFMTDQKYFHGNSRNFSGEAF